jgi:ABC-2 type transport system ATP-binding protein
MTDGVINISNLKKQFGDLTAVDDISFQINQGEIFGLLGPNGAGKTTTINMICGLLPPTSGEINFNKEHLSVKNIRALIGICPQENVYWPRLTCYEQLYFTGRMYDIPSINLRTKTTDLLHLLGLQEKAHIQAKKLSGGMKRRLNICLALIHDPPIIVLDEPEAGLDPQSRILVRDFIKSLAKEKTVILTTHNMDEADRLADRVAIIDHGQLLLLDTPDNLKKTIGEGDLLEIDLNRADKESIDKIIRDFSNRFNQVKYHDSTLIIHSKNLVEAIPEITNKITSSGLNINKVTLRENTLEDVFIHLTGRTLRQ